MTKNVRSQKNHPIQKYWHQSSMFNGMNTWRCEETVHANIASFENNPWMAFFYLWAIGVKENMGVMCIDVPNAFIEANACEQVWWWRWQMIRRYVIKLTQHYMNHWWQSALYYTGTMNHFRILESAMVQNINSLVTWKKQVWIICMVKYLPEQP